MYTAPTVTTSASVATHPALTILACKATWATQSGIVVDGIARQADAPGGDKEPAAVTTAARASETAVASGPASSSTPAFSTRRATGAERRGRRVKGTVAREAKASCTSIAPTTADASCACRMQRSIQ